MRRFLSRLGTLALLLSLGCAHSAAPFSLFNLQREKDKQEFSLQLEKKEKASPNFLNGLGSEGRTWEVTGETAFGTQRVLTGRLEVARAIRIPTTTLTAVVRVRARSAFS